MPDRDLQFYEHVAALKRDGQAFAVAMVVSRRAPVSSHLGDRAIIFAGGRMQGFVGGACSREIVRRQALEALGLGSPRLVQIRPEALPTGFTANADHVVVPMSCASEGAVDVYIEPYQRPFAVLVVGFSPVAEALARLALGLEYEVTRVVSEEERRDLGPDAARTIGLGDLPAYLAARPAHGLAAVVASQGHYDEPALDALLRVRPLYLGLLASRKRGAQVRELLGEQGFGDDALAAIHNPVGIDLGATTPAEVAVSILAEIIQVRQRSAATPYQEPLQAPQDLVQIDPVCAMEVTVAGAMHTAAHAGHTYYFCCPRCKAAFERDPARYLVPMGSA